MRLFSTVVVFFVTCATSAQASGQIGYGSRVGMDVDVVSMSGLDTSQAIIKTRHTRRNAVKFCREYVGKVTEKCIQEELSVRLNDVIEADCKKGTFTNFWGDRLRFGGKNKKADDLGAAYMLVNIGTGEVADGSSASNYPTNMAIFQALCPSLAPSDP